MRILLALVFLGWTTSASAEAVEIEAEAIAVDVTARSIKVSYDGTLGKTTSELDVSKNASIVINGRPGNLEAIKKGHTLAIIYHKDFAVVTAITVTGRPASPEDGGKTYEVTLLHELNSPNWDSGVWVSRDGLTIYWHVTDLKEKSRWIWTAHRKRTDSLFEGMQRLVPGHKPTVTEDGLEIVFIGIDNQPQVAWRTNINQPFKRPHRITELSGLSLSDPCLSPDGLTLLFTTYKGAQPVGLWITSRKDRRSRWQPPRKLQVEGSPTLRSPFRNDDHGPLFAIELTSEMGQDIPLAVFSPVGGQRFSGSLPVAISLDDASKPTKGFDPKTFRSPRYVAATKELFFSGRLKAGEDYNLMVIRNCDLSTFIGSE